MKHRWIRIVGPVVLVGTVFPALFVAQTAQTAQTEQAPGPYARIAILRALDGQTVDLEAGYIRHLEWHRQAKDTFAWYSYSVWASTERQRWIIYATFGHTSASLSKPVSPASDSSRRVHNGGSKPGNRKGLRGCAGRRTIKTAGRDALVPHGRGRKSA